MKLEINWAVGDRGKVGLRSTVGRTGTTPDLDLASDENVRFHAVPYIAS